MSTSLRPQPRSEREPEAPGDVLVVRVDPADGAAGVFRDAAVVVRLSSPAQPRSVTADALKVVDATGRVPGTLRLSPDRRVVIWRAERLLAPDSVHFVVVSGLRDARGREVAPHLSRFLACRLVSGDLTG